MCIRDRCSISLVYLSHLFCKSCPVYPARRSLHHLYICRNSFVWLHFSQWHNGDYIHTLSDQSNKTSSALRGNFLLYGQEGALTLSLIHIYLDWESVFNNCVNVWINADIWGTSPTKICVLKLIGPNHILCNSVCDVGLCDYLRTHSVLKVRKEHCFWHRLLLWIAFLRMCQILHVHSSNNKHRSAEEAHKSMMLTII